MTPMIIGLLIFFVIHAVPMQRELRDGLAERFGENTYKAAFSVIALVGLVLIIVGYGKMQVMAGKNPQIWLPPSWTSHITILLMIPAMILLVAAYVPSNIKRIAKHPMLVAIKLWAVAHLLSNGDLASMVLFGSFLAYAVVDRISVKRRGPAHGVSAGGGVTGDVIAVAVGLVLYVLIVFYLHEWLIGVAPMPGMAA
ncbi:MAG: NnrU family protein [Alphaproteobacteria bacterium]|nr:NnrU family protein [Alphaproteobacteria bacterium]